MKKRALHRQRLIAVKDRTVAIRAGAAGAVLAASLAVLLAAGSGCSPSGATADDANQGDGVVSVLYAGGLVKALEEGVGPTFDGESSYSYRGEGRGSVAAANLVRDRLRRPDVFISADADVNSLLMDDPDPSVSWFVTFGRTELVLAYSDKGPLAEEFAAVERGERSWHEVLRNSDLRLGRSDPNLDPSGYRTLFLFELAEEELGLDGLKEDVLVRDRNPAQIFPEEELGARLEVGQLDAAFLYRTVAVPHDLPFLELPPEVNQGSSDHAAAYAAHSYTNSDTGAVYRGRPVTFTATVLEDAPNPEGAEEFLRFLLGPEGADLLGEFGLLPADAEVGGDAAAVPVGLRPAIGGEGR